MSSPKLTRTTLRMRLREILVERVLTGHYAPGERIVELRIADEFGTSLAPVREAMRELESLGLVRSAPHKGTFVCPFEDRALMQIYVARGAIEEAAARLATPRLAGDATALRAACEGMQAAAAVGDRVGVASHSVAFHRAILEASGNSVLLALWNSLLVETQSAITLNATPLPLAEIAASHLPILEAIEAGDAEAAATLSRAHQAAFAGTEHRAVGPASTPG
jgi:DNA-binding GntR family transcriptional regulator